MKPAPLTTFASLFPQLEALDGLSVRDFPTDERAALLSFFQFVINEAKLKAMRSRQAREDAA